MKINILLAIMLLKNIHRTAACNIPSDVCAPSLSRGIFP